jgi:chorismate mutase
MLAVHPDPRMASLRQRIDQVDRRILELVAERARIVLEVGDYKHERGLPVYDPSRERAMLEQLCEAIPAPLDGEAVQRIFERLIDECRRLEQRHVTNRDAAP